MSFFFKKPPLVGVEALCKGVPASGSVTDTVISPRTLAAGEAWVDTGLSLITSFDVADEAGKPLIILSVDSAKILAANTDTFSSYKDTVLECGGATQTDKVYVCALLPGQTVSGGVSTNCYICTGASATLTVYGECC